MIFAITAYVTERLDDKGPSVGTPAGTWPLEK